MIMPFCASTSTKLVRLTVVLFISLLTHAVNADSLENLTIKRGEVYKVPSSEEFLTVDSLHIGNDAKIELPPGMVSWSLQAAEAHIGNDVKIIGSGSLRKDNASVMNATKTADSKIGSAQSCGTPINGKRGQNGESGIAGTDINLSLGLMSFGSLSVNVGGGNGENGSPGENGQNADQTEGCRLTSGGNAGAGGDAGEGGNSGHVSIVYTTEGDQALLQKARSETEVIQTPGKAGSPGKPGKPGKGSAGTYVIKKTLTGNKKWVSGGGEGKRATDGAVARIGAKGRVDIQVLLTSSPKTAQKNIVPQNTESVEQQLDALRNQVDQLLRRVEQLESK